MTIPIVRTDKSAFDRVREAILNREDPDKTDTPTGHNRINRHRDAADPDSTVL